MKKVYLIFILAAIIGFAGWAFTGEPRFWGATTFPAATTFNSTVTFNDDISLGAAKHLVLPLHDDATTPTLAFGDGDTGFYQNYDNYIRIAQGGVAVWEINAIGITGFASDRPRLLDEASSLTNPTLIPYGNDLDTGLGGANADDLVLIVGGVQVIKMTEATTTEAEITGRVVMSDSALSVTTEANITDPLASSVLLITGDNDSDNDAIDLQNGETAGQLIYIIAEAAVDTDDTITINMADTTCTNCPAIVFNKVGENATLVWTGTTWATVGLQTSL